MIDTEECPRCFAEFMEGYMDGHDCELHRAETNREVLLERFSWDYEELLTKAANAHPTWFPR